MNILYFSQRHGALDVEILLEIVDIILSFLSSNKSDSK